MGTNRTRVDRKIRQPIDPSVWHRLTGGLAERPEPFNEDAIFAVEYFDEAERGWRRLWREHGREIVRLWAEHRPGRRPALWWRFDAPEPRRRLGGTSGRRLTSACRLRSGVRAGHPEILAERRSRSVLHGAGRQAPGRRASPSTR
jgi:hypothetical protein